MKARLVILLVISVVVILGLILVSLKVYSIGQTSRFDDYILQLSKLGPDRSYLDEVHPAIVKAIISRRTGFRLLTQNGEPIRGERGEVGLMYVPEEAFQRYMDYHVNEPFYVTRPGGKKEFAYVCVNRDMANHDKARVVYESKATKCPVCGQTPVNAMVDPAVNIRVGTWYLAYVTAYLKENTEGLSEWKIKEYAVEAFSVGLETFKKATKDLTDFSELEKARRVDMDKIMNLAKEYSPGLEARAGELGIEWRELDDEDGGGGG